MAKVTIDNFADEIQKILDEYGEEVGEKLSEITTRIGKKGAELLKSESLEKFPNSNKHKKRYGTTWTARAERKRLYTTVTIYNSQPGLTHLLENGHLVKDGTGRVLGEAKAHPHISEVEQKLIKEFEKEVKSRL